MKKAILLFVLPILAFSCKKSDTTPSNNNNNNNSGCGDGFICFKLDGNSISKQGGGYELADTFLFVKYEEGVKQLSIDIFGKTTGKYTVSDKRKTGNGRIYYFPSASSSDTFFMAEAGSLNISTYDASAKKISGTFSGTLYNYKGDTETFLKTDSVVIKDGEFTNISVPKQ